MVRSDADPARAAGTVHRLRAGLSSVLDRGTEGRQAAAHMDSPLSRSPGSRVLSGVGLPTTLLSSVLGGPQRLLEYWGAPPHSSSLLPLLPRQAALQWAASPRTRPWELPEAPSRGWPAPPLGCQLEVGGSAWPWARKRFTSSSPANSAKMVVFPRTHLWQRDRPEWLPGTV